MQSAHYERNVGVVTSVSASSFSRRVAIKVSLLRPGVGWGEEVDLTTAEDASRTFAHSLASDPQPCCDPKESA